MKKYTNQLSRALCGECRRWLKPKTRCNVSGINIMVAVGVCDIDGSKHERCGFGCK